ncbi:hypothetical protein LOTGIDRAFT_233341 [Lottia gigantea]|uniref:Clustered mitochondria protein homolog n=1 Tax=Lottia gigantea TaxID=225164 RepID=V4A9J0_LOTGI|nr:hypothetical protein LOTGIDRAFT_233341 [Lottia gigantea]ESO91745.1 hypothetical protein LOTGIDRAFT_233341 [Lottia gigantea]
MAGNTAVDENKKADDTCVDAENNRQTNESMKPKDEEISVGNKEDNEAVCCKNGDGEENKTTEEKDLQEIVLIQDTGFTIKISPPNVEAFELPVSSMELVQEIYQVLMDREDTCHRTCFSLQLDGVTLDNFSELKSIESLKEGSVVKVVEEPYSIREARIHVRHIRDLLKSLDLADAYNGSDCMSLSFLNTVTAPDVVEKKKSKSESIDCTPPDYILPNNKERPLLPLHPGVKEQKAPQCLKVLTYSGWNPPPGNRRMHGDLLYLYLMTLEDKKFHITASTKGFFINHSTEIDFNPQAIQPSYLSHSLIDLMNQISPAFKKNFALLLKKRCQKHPFERVPAPYQVNSWMAPLPQHSIDYIRAEDAFSTRLGYEEHIPGQTRDWNEEIQMTRELSCKNLPDRLIRERAIFKVHSDFVAAATRGAQAVIDGNVMPINPGEDSKMQMFIWNNIFFSLGFDVKDHYKDFGGDAAAYVAPGNDLQGVKAYFGADQEGLYTLGTVVVDYRGYRVTAQSIIPGILEREQEQSVVYGSVDFGKTIVTHDKYKDLLSKTAAQLKIRPHKVINNKDEEIELFSSIECKGIIGNDQRHYILDLLRTFPPDANYLRVKGEELSKEMKEHGYPKKHPHKLACLRQELVDAFVENRYLAFVRHAAFQFQQLQLTKQNPSKLLNKDIKPVEKDINSNDNKATEDKIPDGVENGIKEKIIGNDNKDTQEEIVTEEAKKIVETLTGSDSATFEENTKDIVKKAATAVCSLSDTEFNVTFNPDVFQPHVKHINPQGETLKREKQIVKDAAEFLVLHQIPTMVNDCLDHSSSPIDGTTLTEAMHNRGINVRYLGKVTEFFAKYQSVSYVYTICVGELICRSAKHIYKTYMQGVDMANLSSAIAHFLNCLLGSYNSPTAHISPEDMQARRARRKKKSIYRGHGIAADNTEWMNETPKSLWKKIIDEAQDYYHYTLECDSIVYISVIFGYSIDYISVIFSYSIVYISVIFADNTEWMNETPKSLWKKIIDEAQDYYHYTLECDSIDSCIEKYDIQRVSLLRAFCSTVGIQILLREYDLSEATKQIFNEDDIINVFPIVKHMNPKVASDAYHFFTSGQNKIQQGLLREGYELITEAWNLLNNVYIALHPEISACLRLLARLNYIMGDYSEALSYQQKAVMMSERVHGIDHPITVTEYAHLALYSFANNHISNALRLMYRARYLALLCHGENHPEVALIDSNIGLILHALEEYELSLRFLENALKLNLRYYGVKSLKAAMSYHLLARTYSCQGNFRAALQSEKEAFSIYKQSLGDDHERTKESSECLKHLTQQAVVFQKKINEYCQGEKNMTFPPIQIQTPSLSSVLDTLNVINGIVFVQLSDLERLKREMNKQKAKTTDKTESPTEGNQNGASESNTSSDSENNGEQLKTSKEASPVTGDSPAVNGDLKPNTQVLLTNGSQ